MKVSKLLGASWIEILSGVEKAPAGDVEALRSFVDRNLGGILGDAVVGTVEALGSFADKNAMICFLIFQSC